MRAEGEVVEPIGGVVLLLRRHGLGGNEGEEAELGSDNCGLNYSGAGASQGIYSRGYRESSDGVVLGEWGDKPDETVQAIIVGMT